MRRFLPALLLAVFAGSTLAAAASWHSFADKHLGFGLQYPAGWHVAITNQPTLRQAQFSYQRGELYAVTVTLLPLKPGSSAADTIKRFVAYERGQGSDAVAHIHWTATRLGRASALAGVLQPPTEGGVVQSQALYLAGWRTRLYEVTDLAYGKHALAKLSQFPAIYAQILRTWRFL